MIFKFPILNSLRCLPLFALVCFAATRAFAAPPPKDQPKQPEIVWGFSEYPPFKYTEDGVHKGIDVMVMEEVAQKLGVKIKFYDCPFKRCVEALKDGDVDFMTAFGLREERKVFAEFVYPPYNQKNAKVLYIKKGSKVRIDKYEDLYKYTIGVKNGVSYFPRFDKDERIKKEVVNEVEMNLRKLDQGRIDAAINTEIQMDYLIIKNGFDQSFVKSKFRDETGEDYIGVSKKSALIKRKKEIDKIVADMVQSGRTKEIVSEFFNLVRRQYQAKK